MMTDTPRPPSPATLWIEAARPRTLLLAASAVFLGFGLAAMEGHPRPGIFLLALITALLLQILSNLANDYGDALTGADTADRTGPLRLVGSGLTTPQHMFRAVILAAVLALVFGFALVSFGAQGDWVRLGLFLLLGAASIAAAVLYTVGKLPYGYIGLGDLMAGLFFGPVAVWGTAILCGAEAFAPLILPGTAAGFCSTMVLNVNNMRDIKTDRRAGKMTVAARLGIAKAPYYHLTLAAMTLLCWIAFWLIYRPAFLPGLVFIIPLLDSVRHVVTKPKDPANLNAQLRNTIFGSAFCAVGMGVLCLFVC